MALLDGLFLFLHLGPNIIRRRLCAIMWRGVQLPIGDMKCFAILAQLNLALVLKVVHYCAFEVVTVLCCVNWHVLQIFL